MDCPVCKQKVSARLVGGKYFVLCQSDPCSVREDNGERHIGRILSNGKDTAQEAEKDYQDSLNGNN